MKKFISLVLVVMMLVSCVCISATAADEDAQVLHFDTNASGWTDPFAPWQSKKEACTDEDGDGIWTYDITAKGFEIEEGKLYVCIFSNNNGTQIHNLLFDSTVLGNTAYGVDFEYENPADSSKKAQAGFWKGQDETVFGPEMCITSVGNVVGTCIPNVTTAFGLFEDFVSDFDKVDNVRTYSGKTDQQIVDDIAIALGLSIDDVGGTLADYEILSGWNAADTTIPEENGLLTVQTAVNQYREQTGDEFTTRRYYFLRPDGTNGETAKTGEVYDKGMYVPSWGKRTTSATHIYWENTERLDPESYIGYAAMRADSDYVYYADVPDFVTSIKWNNGINYKESDALWQWAHETFNIACEYYDVGESDNYPMGLDSFDNMIFVIDPDQRPWAVYGEPGAEPGEWYYYYGDGCYGLRANGDSLDCMRDDHTHEKRGDVHIIAGDKEVCGTNWDPTDLTNELVYNEESGLFEKVYDNVPDGIHVFLITTNYVFPKSGSGVLDGCDFGRDLIVDVKQDGARLIITFDGVDKADFMLLPPSMVTGDVNLDGELSILDATKIQLVIAKLEEFANADAKALADVNGDGEVTILDVTNIQLILAKVE